MKKGMTFFMGICFLFVGGQSKAQSVKFDYVTQIGGPGAQTHAGDVYKNRTLAVDKDGFVYNAGKISSGEVEFDVLKGGKSLKVNDGGHYIAKYDSVQNLIWVKQYGNQISSSQTQGVAVDTFGNIYLAGYFMDIFDLDPGPNKKLAISAGSTDMFIIKLDSAGNHLWSKAIGEVESEFIYGMTLDDSGNVFATGFISGNDVDFSPGSANSLVPKRSCFVLKLNTSGGFEWVKSWKDKVGSPVGRSITLDNQGNILTTGEFSNQRTDFDPGTGPADTFFLSGMGNRDVFVSKLDKSGNFLWARSFGGKHQDQGFSIAVDEAGAVYTTGIFADTGDFYPWGSSYKMVSMNPYSGPSTSNMEVFVSKIDANGNFVWARQINGPGSNWGYSIAAGKGKAIGVYVTGVFREHADFYKGSDTITLQSTNGSSGSAFLFKLDTSGVFEWSYPNGGVSSGTVVVDDYGNVYTAGAFFGASADFDPDPNKTRIVNTIGLIDGYIHKMRWCQLTDTVSEIACKTFIYKGIVYNKTGIFEVPNPQGCDSSSTIVLDLTIYTLEPVITINEKTLSTLQTYNTYQWMRNDAIVNGATNRAYTVTKNGEYRVIVMNELGCTDTSDAYIVTNLEVGISEVNWAGQVTIYPNPTQDNIYVTTPIDVNIQVFTVEGKMVKEIKNAKEIKLDQLANGLYFLKVYDLKGVLIKNQKIVKRN